MPTFSTKELADKLKAQLQGKPDLVVSNLAAINDANTSSLSFIKDKNPKTVNSLLTKSSAAAVLVLKALKDKLTPANATLIFVDDPQLALTSLIPLFHPTPINSGEIHPKAEIHPSAIIGENCQIAAYCVIGPNVKISDNCVLHPQVVVYPNVTIGSNCVIHASAVIREDVVIGSNCQIQPGAVIGADGFGYIFQPGLGLKHIPQVGHVVLGDQVDIGANTCIDRAALGKTTIGCGSKLDNLVQVGHNVKIGQHCILCGQVGIGGSAEIGDQVTLGGNAGVADHVKIIAKSRFAGKSGVSSNVEKAGDYAGYPVIPIIEWQRITACLRKLPTFFKKLT